MALTSIEKFFHKLAIGEDLEHLKNVVNSKDPEDEQKTALHKASEKGDLWNVKALVFLGVEMKARDKDGKTPLILRVIQLLRNILLKWEPKLIQKTIITEHLYTMLKILKLPDVLFKEEPK